MVASMESQRPPRPGPDYRFPEPNGRTVIFAGSSDFRETSEPWTGIGRAAARAMATIGYPSTEIRRDTPGAINPRIVANGGADLGATNHNIIHGAYNGVGAFEGEPTRENLRVIATLCRPSWFAIAVSRESRITDLAQIKERQLPVTVLATAGADALASFGVTPEEIESFGGRVVSLGERRSGRDIDVLIGNFYVAYTTVASAWLEALFARDFRFLDIPDAYIEGQVASEAGYRGFIPEGYAPGVNRDIPTVANPYLGIYTRDDAPDDFVSAFTKSLDENRDFFRETHLNLSLDYRHIARHARAPFHPAAQAYYEAQGYPIVD